MPTPPGKNPWHDRFASPDRADFRGLYEDEPAEIIDDLVELIHARTGAQPSTEWRGVAWKWTLVFRRPGEQEPWAYIIPTEPSPTLALPIISNPLPPADLKKLPRFIRDSIRSAPRVGQVCWTETPIETADQLREFDRFIEQVTEAQPA